MSEIDRVKLEIIGIVFPVIGSSCLLLAMGTAISTYHFANTASRADGTVVRLFAGGAHPLIRFVPTGTNKAVEFSGNGMINYATGDKVTVLYTKDPLTADIRTNIDNPGALWFPSLLAGFLGGIFTIVGLHVRKESAIK
jgi:hypothetical protein